MDRLFYFSKLVETRKNCIFPRMQQTEKFWNMLRMGVFFVLGAMILTGIAFIFVPKVRQSHEYQATRDELQTKIDEVCAAEKQLKTKQQQFKTDPVFVEKVAHEVGYAHKDEMIFHFPETNQTAQP